MIRAPISVAVSAMLLTSVACQHQSGQRDDNGFSHGGSSGEMRREVVEVARANLGRRHVRVGNEDFRADCSGTVRGFYAAAGHRLDDHFAGGGNSDSETLFALARDKGRVGSHDPHPGDAVFFHNTYDRNHDGRENDLFTHIAVVESVAPGGTVTIIHRLSGRIVRHKMNPDRPEAIVDHAGARMNDYLRRKNGRISGATTGQLFHSYGSFPPSRRPSDN